MDFNSTIDLIVKDLDDARNIIDDLKKYPGVPFLQVELAKSKCKSAGEVITLLKGLMDTLPIVQKEPTQQPDENKPEQQIELAEDEEESKDKPKKQAESSIIADKFSHMSGRFNEQLDSRKSKEDVSEILKTKPITSLSKAIGVNDRFLFIREIFNGNEDAYIQAIAKLENTKSLPDARAVILSYTGSNNENIAMDQLLDLVKRKLLSNE